MPEVAFVMSERQSHPLRELAETLGYELERQSVPCALHLGRFPEPRASLVYVLLDPNAYLTAEGESARPADEILRRTIFVCTEPPPAAAEDGHIALLRKAGAVFVLDQRSVVAMHRLGIPARLIRPGYSRSLDRFDAAAPRPIDVLFLGTHSLRRTRYLSRAARVLSRHNCVLQICEDTPNASEIGSPLAQARWSLLARTKVLIDLHRGEETWFDWRGAVDAIHAGAVVVAEPSIGIAPLVAGENVVVTSADSLPYVVEDLLADEQRLARLRSSTYERLRGWIPYALTVAILRAAVVELVGEPVPSSAALGRPKPGSAAAETVVTRSAPQRTSELEPRSPEPTNVKVAHESPAWRSRRPPRVTAVVPAHGGDEAILATLDSLARATLRDFELVVVDRRDVERTRRAVADWMSVHDGIASRLVLADVSGVGAAMNVGLDFARGAFCLVLAPGQELYPRCLEELTRTLTAMPDTAFAYPIQEVTGADDFVIGDGDYLLNYLEWDSERVRVRNDIHFPALTRTEALRRLGGFATDAGLARFEDYDLWCRMADRGWRGHLVAQTLVRRRASAGFPPLSVPQP